MVIRKRLSMLRRITAMAGTRDFAFSRALAVSHLPRCSASHKPFIRVRRANRKTGKREVLYPYGGEITTWRIHSSRQQTGRRRTGRMVNGMSTSQGVVF